MGTTRMGRYERRLLEERARARTQVGAAQRQLRDESDRGAGVADTGDDVDRVAARMAREEEAAIATRGSAELSEIDAALRTLYRAPSTYGVCIVCGKRIAAERLDVLPETRLCARHARRRETARSGN